MTTEFLTGVQNPAADSASHATPQTPGSALHGILEAIGEVQESSRRRVIDMLHQAADHCDVIASSRSRVEDLLQSTGRIAHLRTRDAAIEALGFDHDTAVGLGIRIANSWKVFRNGRAALHKRPPLTTEEASQTLKKRALQLRLLADSFAGDSGGDPVSRRRRLQQAVRFGLTRALVTWDVVVEATGMPKGAGMAGNFLLAALSEKANDKRWEFDKLIALTPAMTIQDLEEARARFTKEYALNRIGIVASPIPFSGAAVALFGTVTSNDATRATNDFGLHDLLEAAAASSRQALDKQ
jgi:hypothetical protein